MFLLLFFLSTLLSNIEIPLEEIIASQSSSASFDTFLQSKNTQDERKEVPTSEEKAATILSSLSARPECPDRGVSKGRLECFCSQKCIEGCKQQTEGNKEATSIVTNPTSITFTNAIEPSMLTYKHWTGKYAPDVFTIQINGTEVAQGESYELTRTKDPIEISFNYSFMNGMRKGSKTVTYAIDENITDAKITFSWQNTWKLIVSNATPLKQVSA